MVRRFRFISDSRGATAIEYAIIAALIGLGIVGSLVTTRGSLSATFGTASTQMDASTAARPSSTSSRAYFWQGKTLAPGWPQVAMHAEVAATTYMYTDGTVARFDQGPMCEKCFNLFITDPNGKVTSATYGGGTNGDVYYATIDDIAAESSRSSTDFLNGVPQTMNYAVSGSPTRTNIAADAYMVTSIQDRVNDANYFRDITAKPGFDNPDPIRSPACRIGSLRTSDGSRSGAASVAD